MKILKNHKSNSETHTLLGDLINVHLEKLLPERYKNQKKIIEICHAGKFLTHFDNNIIIENVCENPDFIINIDSTKIGLEHQILVDNKLKEREGFFENLFSAAECELQKDLELPNFLISCHLIPYVNFKINEKQRLIISIIKTVKHFIQTQELIENPLIENISMTDHTQKNLYVNLGGWFVKDVTPELIYQAVRKKEKRLSAYKENSGEIQWLLIVIGGVGASSFNLYNQIELNLITKFDKVYILEDFNNKLYELK